MANQTNVKHKTIESKFFKIDHNDAFLNKEYNTLNVKFCENKYSLNLSENDYLVQDGQIIARIKLFDTKDQPRIYKIYNKQTKNVEEWKIDKLLETLKSSNWVESVKKFDLLNEIKEIKRK